MMDKMMRYCGAVLLSILTMVPFGCNTRPQNQNANAPQPKNANASTSANANTMSVMDPSEGPQGYIDGVTGDAKIGGEFAVVGWAADLVEGAPVKKVEVLLDNNVIAEAVLGKDRLDVYEVTTRKDWQRSGWEATITLTNIAPGLHRVTAVAYNRAGSRADLNGARDIQIQ